MYTASNTAAREEAELFSPYRNRGALPYVAWRVIIRYQLLGQCLALTAAIWGPRKERTRRSCSSKAPCGWHGRPTNFSDGHEWEVRELLQQSRNPARIDRAEYAMAERARRERHFRGFQCLACTCGATGSSSAVPECSLRGNPGLHRRCGDKGLVVVSFMSLGVFQQGGNNNEQNVVIPS